MKVTIAAYPDTRGPGGDLEFYEWGDYVVMVTPKRQADIKIMYKIPKSEWARLLKAGTGFLVKEE